MRTKTKKRGPNKKTLKLKAKEGDSSLKVGDVNLSNYNPSVEIATGKSNGKAYDMSIRLTGEQYIINVGSYMQHHDYEPKKLVVLTRNRTQGRQSQDNRVLIAFDNTQFDRHSAEIAYSRGNRGKVSSKGHTMKVLNGLGIELPKKAKKTEYFFTFTPLTEGNKSVVSVSLLKAQPTPERAKTR